MLRLRTLPLPALPLPALPLALVLVAIARPASAAPPPDAELPESTANQDPASSGATDIVTDEEFSKPTDIAADDKADERADDVTEFDVALGGIFSTGNSRSLAFTGTSNLRIRRKVHQFGAGIAGNYGAAGVPDSDRYDTNVSNIQGLARYDLFFAEDWTAFTQVTARHDPFQGLEYRMNIDPGFAYYVLNKPTHRLWFEAGYDLQYDVRTDDSRILLDDDGPVLDANGDTQLDPAVDKVQLNHAARLFAGYSNKLSKAVSFDTGLEYLQSFIVARRFRLNYLAALNTQLAERFSLAVTFTLRYEHEPLPNVRPLDTITALSLAYRFF